MVLRQVRCWSQPLRIPQVSSAIWLCARYAMSSIDATYRSISGGCPTPGTDAAYRGTRERVRSVGPCLELTQQYICTSESVECGRCVSRSLLPPPFLRLRRQILSRSGPTSSRYAISSAPSAMRVLCHVRRCAYLLLPHVRNPLAYWAMRCRYLA